MTLYYDDVVMLDQSVAIYQMFAIAIHMTLTLPLHWAKVKYKYAIEKQIYDGHHNNWSIRRHYQDIHNLKDLNVTFTMG